MAEKNNILFSGASIVRSNKRYVVWFWLLNLALATLGSEAFSLSAHKVLDHSQYSQGLVKGFDLGVLSEMFFQPEFGALRSKGIPAMMVALLFFVLAMIFLPGVLQGYGSDHRISRAEFWRGCGVNLWRFVRLTILFVIVGGVVSGILFGIQNALVDAADASTYEKLPFYVQLACLTIIFLVMTAMRIWFDLAETSTVLSDQPAVRKSLGSAFRQTRKNLGRLLGSYAVIAIMGAFALAVGIVLWNVIVPPASVIGAFIMAQLIAFSLLGVRFWQRATTVAFYKQSVIEEPIEFVSVAPVVPIAATTEPVQL